MLNLLAAALMLAVVNAVPAYHQEPASSAAALFNSVDANQDGKITFEQFKRLGIKKQLGTKLERNIEECFEKTDAVGEGGGGHLWKFFNEKGVDSAVLPGDTVTVKEWYDAFKKLDKDQSGEIDEGELDVLYDGCTDDEETKALVLRFLGDVNGDGKVDAVEYFAAFARMDADESKKIDLLEWMAGYHASKNECAQVLFEAYDKSGDGKIDVGEWIHQFHIMDKDDYSGTLDLEEVTKIAPACTSDHVLKFLGDVDGDKKVTMEEYLTRFKLMAGDDLVLDKSEWNTHSTGDANIGTVA